MSLKSLTPFVAAVVGISCFAVRANAQAVTLREQLAAQYKLAKMGSDSSGPVVVDEGTLLTVQKGGIIGLPYKAVTVRTATYENGTVHASDVTHNSTAQKVGKVICGFHKCPTTPDAASDDNATKLFKVGDKVWLANCCLGPNSLGFRRPATIL